MGGDTSEDLREGPHGRGAVWSSERWPGVEVGPSSDFTYSLH